MSLADTFPAIEKKKKQLRISTCVSKIEAAGSEGVFLRVTTRHSCLSLFFQAQGPALQHAEQQTGITQRRATLDRGRQESGRGAASKAATGRRQ